ncbi:hypothetical protein ABIA35_009754 [Catenulispora sp. MAP12-49]|uniref:hypothetical protein n=1 Tax=Catenulispora sp. MAP12-49 TaxID=3156302 RepID=UPI003516B5D3
MTDLAALPRGTAPDRGGLRSPRRRRSTPRVLMGCAALVLAASLVFAAIAASMSGRVRSGFDAIGHTEAPQVVAANNLVYSLNDMDANLANVLMVGDKQLGPGIDRASFTKLFEQDRADADHDLQLAAVHAGAGGAAAQQVGQALDSLGSYEALAAQVMYLDAGHADRPAGQVPAAEAALFAQATDLMRQSVLPAAKTVVASNGQALESSYESRHSAAEAAVWWIAGAGIVLLAALGGTQWFLLRRTNRLVNPPLAAATVLMLVVTVWGASTMSGAAEHLRSAKKDAFDSVAALTAAKALSTDANADESRIIVDPSRAAQYQDSFLAKSRQLMDVGAGATLGTYDAAVQTALGTYFGDPVRHPVTFGGYFGTELHNITFAGERATAEQMLRTYQTYELDDRKLRQKLATDLPEAVRFDTSPAASDSDGAFVAYASALQSVIDINSKAFDSSIDAGLSGLQPWPWVPLGGAVAVVALLVIGVRPRLAEYR